MAATVTLCECFARDGLQNEPAFVPTEAKLAVLDAFAAAGFPRIEATSYSHPKHVPAFADAAEVLAALPRPPRRAAYKATCPNEKAVTRAIADADGGHGADELSLLVSATEAHTRRNLRTTRADQWRRVEAMAGMARGRFTLVGVISVALGCPFEGRVDPARVVEDAVRFADLGATLVTIGDTVGLGTPAAVRDLFARLAAALDGRAVPVAHFHDSRGTAIANCLAALDAGATHFDSAMGGVGGHPHRIRYGGGMTGNVATEDLVNVLEMSGVPTGLDLDAVLRASRLCEEVLGRDLNSAVARAGWGDFTRKETADAG